MMVCIHAAIGAGTGSLFARPGASLAAGAATHLICDLIPHRDYPIHIEAPLAFAVLVWIGKRYGLRSPQFLGALGAILPDGENALVIAGAFSQSRTVFPTHNENSSWFLGHGRKLESPLSQLILAGIFLWLAEKKRMG